MQIRLAILVAVLSVQAALAQERPAAFVDAATVVPGLIADMRYAGVHNFVGRPIDGYEAPRCLLTQPAADALAEVARDLAPAACIIKAFDCYRPTRAVANFMHWARDLNDHRRQGRVLSQCRQAHAVSRRLYRLAFRPFARLDHRHDVGERGRRTNSIWVRRSISSVRNRGPPIRRVTRRGSTPIACCSPPRCAAAAFAATSANGGTSRYAASRFRIRVSIFR